MSGQPLLSILVATLVSRQSVFDDLSAELRRQASEADAEALVEILWLRDRGEASIGAKRNDLVSRATGRFLVFVDDDDRVSPDYVPRILEAIRARPDADCVVFDGEITFRGRHPRRLVHRIGIRDWFEHDGQYLRPPCHITPIRSDIARCYRFTETDWSEDMDWALRISRDGALRSEAVVDAVLYHYRSRRCYAWQWLLDRTQPLRHALGLRWVSRLGIRRRLSALFQSPER